MKTSTAAALALALGIIFVKFSGHCHGELQVGYYKGKCLLNNVETIVKTVVTDIFTTDPTIAPALIRMQFHDCFVKGCDASILLDGNSTEKTAPPNLSVRGYNVIDAAKTAVELVCPGVVSCADIIVIAARDAVELTGGGRYEVETGRRDGLVSLAKNVNLPPPNITVSQNIKAFSQKGLDTIDMVYLLGGHTIGLAHCPSFQDRLYNYKSTGKPDPSMDSKLLDTLKRRCPQNSTSSNTVNLDQNPANSSRIDNSFFQQIKLHKGILQIDQDLALDSFTQAIVDAIAASSDFPTKFGHAMVKLGAVQVLTGHQGEIRKSCRAVN